MTESRQGGWPRGRVWLLSGLTLLLLVISSTMVPWSSSGAPASQATSLPDPIAALAAQFEASPAAPVPYLDGAPSPAASDAVYAGPVSIMVSFTLSNQSRASAMLLAIESPSSLQYREYLTRAEFADEFASSPTFYGAALQFFRSAPGLEVTAYADRIGLSLEGPASAVGPLFGVSFLEESQPGRVGYFVPVGTPTLPAPLAGRVAQVEGLSNYLDAHSDIAGAKAAPAISLPSAPTGTGYPSPVYSGGTQNLWGSDLQVAYDEQALLSITYPTDEVVATILWSGADGSGAPVGPFDPSDVSSYYNQTLPAGQPHPTVVGVPLDGAPAPGPSAGSDLTGATLENTLDLEMIGSVAPGATIYNVYGPTSQDSQTDAALAYILNPFQTPGLDNVSVISNSWGGSDRTDATWNAYSEEAALRGITILAASGDAGDSPQSSKWVGSTVEFPSTAAFDTYGVVAVGGTTLVVFDGSPSDLNYLHRQNEVAWYDPGFSGNDVIGSSGGVSAVYAEPSWQSSSTAAAVIGGAGRGVPDLSAIANNTLILATLGGTTSTYYAYGTSIACPVIAGFVAEMNAIAGRLHHGPMGFLDPVLYSIADEMLAPFVNTTNTGFDLSGSWRSTLPTLPLEDVTVGTNAVYPARIGYDLVTGWGAPDVYNLTMYLVSYNYSGAPFALNGVRGVLDLTGLKVTSYYGDLSVNTDYNASVQQNLFVANSLGAPVYWIQNVIYINGSESSGWNVDFTGWVVLPFYGLYPSSTIYEYNVPAGTIAHTPVTWNMTSWITGSGGPNAVMNYGVNGQTLQLPIPGGAYIIGGYNAQYYWQGRELSNGPFPDTARPGGLAPQFALVGGPSLSTGYFAAPTAGTLELSVEPSGASSFRGAPFAAAFLPDVTQTGEQAVGLSWTGEASTWTLGTSNTSYDQGVVVYTVVNGGNPANYTVAKYPVQFEQSGLPAGTNWSATLAGNAASSSTSSISFESPNGTYAFLVSPASVGGVIYDPMPYSGTVLVAGSQAILAITFQLAAYAVNISETGLPGGTLWYAIVGSGNQSTTASELAIPVTNGTYPFQVGAVGSSLVASPASGTVTINGSSQSVSIVFASGGGGGGLSLFGLSGWLLYGILGVILVVLITAVALAAARTKPTRGAPPPDPGAPRGAPPASGPGPAPASLPGGSAPPATPAPIYGAPPSWIAPRTPLPPVEPGGMQTPTTTIPTAWGSPPTSSAEPPVSPGSDARAEPERCPRCGSLLGAASHRFCPACGLPRGAPAACARCGLPQRPGSRFCGSCGAAL